MKRLFDLVVAAGSLVVLLPLFALVTLAVWREDGRPVLFRQRRVGRDGRHFEILKFRTMRAAAGGPAITAGGDPRVTPTGRVLRRWKLDELPQLWNVVRGEMSLVGPRPEVPEYVALYPPEAREVLSVRPGITGPAQLEGLDEEEALRGATDPDQLYREVLLPRKLAIDLRYARRAGLATDLGILWRTVRRLAFGSGGTSHAAVG